MQDRNEKGEAEASPLFNQLTMGLVAFVLAHVVGSIQARNVKLDGQIAFRQFLRADIADESEAVTELEVGLSDDVAFEARCSRNTEVAAIAQSEDHFLATSDGGGNGHRRRSAATRGGA